MKKLLLITILIISYITVNAQWHFSIASMNYNDNCSSFGASVEVSMRMGMAEQMAAKTYNTKEECERGRAAANMNYSSGGCYLKITTSPCTGGNTGGGGTGWAGAGSGFQAGSLYSSTAIGEPYFTPNVAHSIPDQGRDLEIKLEALNKNFQNATNGIKTGNRSFDKTYREQSDNVSTSKDEDENVEEMYVFIPRIPQVYLDKENSYVTDEDELIVPIDPERIMNQQRDESLEKSQKEIQHRLDLREKKIQHKMDSILLANGGKIPNKNVNEPDWYEAWGEAFFDVTAATYGIMTDAVMLSNDGIKIFESFFDVKVPCSDRLSELEDVMVNSKEVFVESLIGNVSEAASVVADQVVVHFIQPTSEVIGGMVTTGTSTYTTIMNSLSAGNLVRYIATDASKSIPNEINYMLNGGDPNKSYERLGRKYFNYGRDIAKEIQGRNSVREIIKVNDNEKK